MGIAAFDAALAPHSYYLAALLMEQKAELPILGQGGHAFGAIAVLRSLPEDDYCRGRSVSAFWKTQQVAQRQRDAADLASAK